MRENDRRQYLGAALLCFGLALWLGYLGWAAPAGLHAPRVVPYLGATTFGAAGANLLVQARGGSSRAQAVPAFLVALGMALLVGWVAFGRGPRRCSASLGGLGFLPPELLCRTAFGVGALVIVGIAGLMLPSIIRRRGSRPPSSARK
ncbi:MAG TPA: hypothetical protein VFW66_13440 [Gemmatimonadales bacterium]|nr:hypothetical protein [Gemmatimonadales bacterium]